jgi:radical SAM superfamily enzyme YgiQ (UPF0313 family)
LKVLEVEKEELCLGCNSISDPAFFIRTVRMTSDIVDNRRRVVLVQQGVWKFSKESLPLALGYLKAAALADPEINSELSLSIRNFKGGTSVSEVAHAVFSGPIPDVLAFSVFGWNLWSFGSLAQTFRQLNPEGWIIFGGTHVAHQANRLFRLFPELDIVVNGEGEFVFIDLLHSYLKGRSRRDLRDVIGISFKDENGVVVTTAPRERIADLNQIPSPFLTGALEMRAADGSFRYEVALMETNRGCPYRCAFCYWGGAIGQRVRTFSRERLREELDYLGFHGVDTVVLCDANFGMLPSDEAFIEDVISTRDKYGFPRAVETSWAKNKSRVFRSVVRRMKSAGLKSSFTLALQSLNDDALHSMGRQNMKLNEWEELVKWLEGEGLGCYAEMIWNTPGETVQSFLAGYDRLAKHVSRIAVYPLLLMPNTKFAEDRDQYGFVTVRGEHDDFEYVLSHQSISISDHVEMQPFLFWARSIAETSYFRYIWAPLRELGGMSQSQVLLNLADWFHKSSHPIGVELASLQKRAINADFLPEMIARLYTDSRLQVLVDKWWTDAVLPVLPEKCTRFLSETYRFDCLSRPIHEDIARLDSEIEMIELYGARYYVRRNLEFNYDVPALVSALSSGLEVSLEPHPTKVTLYFLVGVSEHIQSHEMVSHYVGKTIEQLESSGGNPFSEPGHVLAGGRQNPGTNKLREVQDNGPFEGRSAYQLKLR